MRSPAQFAVPILLVLLYPSPARLLSQTPAATAVASRDATANPSTLADLQHALLGAWVGTLEYRDYSEPATSTKRVKLPTWLTVEMAGPDLKLVYVYDDGPGKTVTESATISIDLQTAKFSALDGEGKLSETASIAGLAQLKSGRGVLTITGPGTENNAAAQVRTTYRIGRNLLEMTRETAAAGEPFSFRHTYTFVRAAAPSTVGAESR